MTWYLDTETGDVYEDDPQFTGLVDSISTGPGEEYVLQRDLLPVVRATWESEANLGNSPVMNVRAGYILMDMATQNWEFGTPP